ncbi:MAG: trypsin-like serine protease [Myxococcota bacterium]|nr:trypsin-like serine protease [Myxococcota bacterium]
MPGSALIHPSCGTNVALALTWAGAFAAGGACAGPSLDRASMGPLAEVLAPPRGVLDRGADPAVVAVDAGGRWLCTGALVAPDVVLTSRSCVVVSPAEALRMPCGSSIPQALAARDPRSLRILVGDDVGSALERARGRQVIVPAAGGLCGADIALVLLDATIDDIRPLPVRTTGAAQGDRVRTVAYGRFASPRAIEKIVRDHVQVLDSQAEELVLAESACERAMGGPALSESTGEVVGVSSRGDGTSCDGGGAAAVYTRSDVYLALVVEALAQSSGPAKGGGMLLTRKGPIDMGSTCASATDCAAGVCLTLTDAQYCSRTCDPRDRCPPRFRCRKSQDAVWVCGRP